MNSFARLIASSASFSSFVLPDLQSFQQYSQMVFSYYDQMGLGGCFEERKRSLPKGGGFMRMSAISCISCRSWHMAYCCAQLVLVILMNSLYTYWQLLLKSYAQYSRLTFSIFSLIFSLSSACKSSHSLALIGSCLTTISGCVQIVILQSACLLNTSSKLCSSQCMQVIIQKDDKKDCGPMVCQKATTQRANCGLSWNNRRLIKGTEAQPIQSMQNLTKIDQIILRQALVRHQVAQFYPCTSPFLISKHISPILYYGSEVYKIL